MIYLQKYSVLISMLQINGDRDIFSVAVFLILVLNQAIL